MSEGGPMLHVFDGHTASWALLHALASIVERTDDRALMIGNTADARRAIGAGLTRFDRIQARGNRPANAHRQIASELESQRRTHRVLDWRSGATPELDGAMSGAFPARTLDRASIRASWDIDSNTLVIGSANDRPTQVDAMRLVYHAAILSVAERPTVAVVPSGAQQLERAARWAWRHGESRWFVVDDRSPLLLRDAIDVSCWHTPPTELAIDPDLYRAELENGMIREFGNPEPGTRTLEMLAASGQPVVAERCHLTGSLEGENVRLCEPDNDLGVTRAMFKDLVRLEARPDPGALIGAIRGSLAGV